MSEYTLFSNMFPVISRQFASHITSKGLGKSNPGVNRRIKLLKDHPEIDLLDISEKELDSYDSIDFTNAGSSYSAHQSVERKLKRIMEFKRIQRKFFDTTKEPNLLTSSEKEQIRLLHTEDPSTWTPEKLSLSFPATVPIIMKIIKSQWRLRPERIKSHDKAVSENWKSFEMGTLKVSPALEAHIKKFATRKGINRIPRGGKEISLANVVTVTQQPSSSEFVNIIRKTEDNNDSIKSTAENLDTQQRPLSETYVEGGVDCTVNRKHVTLDVLRNQLKSTSTRNGGELSENDKYFLNKSQKVSIKEIKKLSDELKSSLTSDIQKYDSKGNSKSEVYFNEDTTLKINIPEGKKKEGGLYKVKDCYYNDEGEFLYRVPGMT